VVAVRAEHLEIEGLLVQIQFFLLLHPPVVVAVVEITHGLEIQEVQAAVVAHHRERQVVLVTHHRPLHLRETMVVALLETLHQVEVVAGPVVWVLMQ
jgi:hypothetical protein